MFRENVLTQDSIIDRISSTMVPVVVDFQTIQDPKSKEGQLLRPLMKQRKQEQGVWIFSPDGKALGGFVGFGDMVGQTTQVIEDALKVFGPVKLREAKGVATHPYWGNGVMPNGRVCLAEYIRTSDDALRYMDAKSPVLSSVTLSEKEFGAFAPPKAVTGTKWTLPDDVAKKFSRVTSPACYQHAPQPDWVKAVRINAEVRTIKDSVVWLRYDGRIASEHQGAGKTISVQETKLTGEGVYDLKTKSMRSLLLVGPGTLRWPEEPKRLVTFDVLVEWNLKAPESSLQR